MADKEDALIRHSHVATRHVVLMPRDLKALEQLYLHRAITSGQLARLCYSDISYETSRKRLRRLNQSGVIGSANSGRMEGRGRPELIYFLSGAGAKAVQEFKDVPAEAIPTGPPHTYHKEHFLRLVDIRLSLIQAIDKRLIDELEWFTGRESWSDKIALLSQLSEHADALINFRYPQGPMLSVLLEIDTGNFRQTRHWEPKMRDFLRAGLPIWVVSGSVQRIHTLRKWTQPLLDEYGFGPGKCVFAVFDELMNQGVFSATWYRTDGSVTDLRPRGLAT